LTRRLTKLSILLLPAFCWQVLAYETDQVSNRLQPISDSTVSLNDRVNNTLRSIAGEWRGPRNERRFVKRIYWHIGGLHWVDKLERWAMKAPEVDKLTTPRYQSIYAGHPLYASRVTKLFGIGATIRVNDVLIGSDKIGHFISQGMKFYMRWIRSRDEDDAARRSAYTERAIFGQLTTGSYSNADLVANYEGHRFYRSLFEDEIVPGKPAILVWEEDRWKIQREFDFADHVNDYWDEGVNFNHYDRLLYPHVKNRLLEYCDEFSQAPLRYAVRNESELLQRYRHLELRDTSELRLPNLCQQTTFETGRTGIVGMPP